jgi:hypothetical protein
MSVLALPPHLVQPQAPLDPRADWITPEEQLLRFATPLAKGRMYENRMRVTREFDKLPKHLINRIEESAARSMIDYSKLPNLSEQSSRRVKSLFNLTSEKWIEPQPLPTELTDWYKACSLLKSLPKTVPEAPRLTYQILNNKKVPLSLSLVPEEFGTLNQLERDILKPYGEEKYPKDENPLRFRCFWDAAREEHGNVPFAPTHWVAAMEDVLPESRNKNWNEQVAVVDALSQATFVEYKIPNLQQLFSIYITSVVAKGKRLYQAGNEQNGNIYTYGRVTNMTEGSHLCFGGSAPSGVRVHDRCFTYDIEYFGVVPFRKLPEVLGS